MDPALRELYESTAPGEEVRVIIRLADGAQPPSGVRVVARFGPTIITARLPAENIVEVWEDESVASIKAPRAVWCPSSPHDEAELAFADSNERNPEDAPEEESLAGEASSAARPVPEDGSGVVFGICDWGFDFTHPNFRNADGTTRLLVLWDQRGEGDPSAPAPYGYGK